MVHTREIQGMRVPFLIVTHEGECCSACFRDRSYGKDRIPMVAPTGEDIDLFSHCRPHKTRRWMKSFKGGAVSHVQQTFSRPLFRNGECNNTYPKCFKVNFAG